MPGAGGGEGRRGHGLRIHPERRTDSRTSRNPLNPGPWVNEGGVSREDRPGLPGVNGVHQRASGSCRPYLLKRLSSLVSWLVKPSSCILLNSGLCIGLSVTTIRTSFPAGMSSITITLW